MSHTFKNIVLAAGCSLLLLQFVGCKSDEEKEAKRVAQAQKEQEKNKAPEEVFLLRKGTLTTDLQIPGELVSYQKTDIYAKVNSFVQKVSVDVGSQVRKGQLLAEMVAPEISSQISAAYSRWKSQQSTYTASKAFYNRLLETSKTPGTVAGNDLEQAEARANSDYAQLTAAKAYYDEMKVTQSYLTIRAPFDGVITARNINQGAYVGSSGSGDALPMLTLQQQDHMRLVIFIPEGYTSVIHVGDTLQFTTSFLAGQVFSGKIARRASALDQKLRTERVEMDVYPKGSNKTLLPGMTVEVSMPLPMNEASFIVPKTAVINSDAGIRLVRVRDGKFQYEKVSLGKSDEKRIQVFGNLNVNDTIVLSSSEEQREGDDAGKVILSQKF
ncbi:MAG: efflux RND transporter periplasmic adaptor subunit [Chitinophagaceae bacterium]